MSRKEKILRTAFYMLTGSVFMSINASAYIDPATTSYVIQIVAGVVIACGTAIGIFWNKIKRKFKKNNDTPIKTNIKTDDSAEGTVISANDLLDDDSEAK